jgi:hypothetical protein
MLRFDTPASCVKCPATSTLPSGNAATARIVPLEADRLLYEGRSSARRVDVTSPAKAAKV